MAGSLTKISVWNEEHGWQPTNASVVARIHKHGIGSERRMFLCELCNQYATFVYSDIYTPYFKHPKGSDDCDEKTTSSDPYLKENPLGFSLPVKVKIENGHLEIYIGFMPIGESALTKTENEKAILNITAGNKIVKTYNIDHSRFMPNEITYLPVGAIVAELYKVDNCGSIDKNIWPPIVEGIYEKGSLFDKTSGKRLPRNANVEVGKEYLLITKRNFHGSHCRDIEIKSEKSANGYFLYTVKAIVLSLHSANFFLAFGARLTDAPAELTQIYPFVLRGSHIVLHEAVKIWFHKTNGFVDTYPSSEAKGQHQSIFVVQGETHKILSLSRFENRTSVLRFMILRRDGKGFHDSFNRQQLANIKVVDNSGTVFVEGQHSKLPCERELFVTSEFDGFVDVISATSNVVTYRHPLRNGEKTVIGVEHKHKYRVFQGLDCVYEIIFTKECTNPTLTDEQLLTKLKKFRSRKIAIHHSFGSIANKLTEMPLTRIWVAKQIRCGQIDIGARDYLLKLS